MLGLMVCQRHLGILSSFLTRGPHCRFALGPTKYVVCSASGTRLSQTLGYSLLPFLHDSCP